MKKNRKSQSAAIRLGPAIKALFLCVFFGGAAVGYVWQQGKLRDLDVIQRTLEVRLDLLRRDNRVLSGQLADLQLPNRLQERLRLLHIHLQPAIAAQLVRISEPARIPEKSALLGATGERPSGDHWGRSVD